MTRALWVVEARNGTEWEPEGQMAYLSRHQARESARWLRSNEWQVTRVVRYVPESA